MRGERWGVVVYRPVQLHPAVFGPKTAAAAFFPPKIRVAARRRVEAVGLGVLPTCIGRRHELL